MRYRLRNFLQFVQQYFFLTEYMHAHFFPWGNAIPRDIRIFTQPLIWDELMQFRIFKDDEPANNCSGKRKIRGIAFFWFGLARNQTQSLHYQPNCWTQLMAEGPKLSNLRKIYKDYLCSYVSCMVFATVWIDFTSCVIARTWKTKWTFVWWKFIV